MTIIHGWTFGQQHATYSFDEFGMRRTRPKPATHAVDDQSLDNHWKRCIDGFPPPSHMAFLVEVAGELHINYYVYYCGEP